MKAQRLLTVPEVARWLGRTENAIRILVKRGRLPAVRVGRRLRFEPRQIQRLIDAGGLHVPEA